MNYAPGQGFRCYYSSALKRVEEERLYWQDIVWRSGRFFYRLYLN